MKPAKTNQVTAKTCHDKVNNINIGKEILLREKYPDYNCHKAHRNKRNLCGKKPIFAYFYLSRDPWPHWQCQRVSTISIFIDTLFLKTHKKNKELTICRVPIRDKN